MKFLQSKAGSVTCMWVAVAIVAFCEPVAGLVLAFVALLVTASIFGKRE